MGGTRTVFHELVNQGWIGGRDQVAGVMRERGIQGVCRGKHPITTRSVKGTGGRRDLVNRDFTAYAPNRLHVAGIHVCQTHIWGCRVYGVCYGRVLSSYRGMGGIFHNENYTVTVEGVGTKYSRGCFSWGSKPAFIIVIMQV